MVIDQNTLVVALEAIGFIAAIALAWAVLHGLPRSKSKEPEGPDYDMRRDGQRFSG
jgi:hypothetical protein